MRQRSPLRTVSKTVSKNRTTGRKTALYDPVARAVLRAEGFEKRKKEAIRMLAIIGGLAIAVGTAVLIFMEG